MDILKIFQWEKLRSGTELTKKKKKNHMLGYLQSINLAINWLQQYRAPNKQSEKNNRIVKLVEEGYLESLQHSNFIQVQ